MSEWVVVGLDNGGTSNNATVLDASGQFLVGQMLETPSLVKQGPDVAVGALAESFDNVLEQTKIDLSRVRAVGLDTPGPASAEGVISAKGATNFVHPGWFGFDFRKALEDRIGLPVVYNNDGNAAALYTHHARFRAVADQKSSVSAIVGTGLGGGVIVNGKVVSGAAGMAGELGHVHIPLHGLLLEGQPLPECNCGFVGDAESIASLTGIEKNLLPFFLARYPEHELHGAEKGAKLLRSYAERQDPMALEIFEQQAMAIGRLFTISANFTDPDAYFIGGGVVEAEPQFRQWFLDKVIENTLLREEQQKVATVSLVEDLDMAGARGSALAARAQVLATD
jgi:predicted NBD/HSP70 family sugar kinase